MVFASFYGDDFTGSVDALLQFRRAGLSGVLVTAPDLAVDDGTDVVGIAGTARSVATEQMAAEILPALRRLRDLDARIVQYKACSTADSAPHVGSIGRVLELAADLFPGAPVPIVFAQPDAGRYTFFSHHFARDDGTVFRLDRQPTMSAHPVTPVTESDLRLHLGAQTKLDLGALHWPAYGELPGLLADQGTAGVVCDAVSDEDLDRLATAILAGEGQRFVIGSGGISGALGRQASVSRRLSPLTTTIAPAAGPTLVLNGSRSQLTRRQIEAATAAGWVVLDLFAADTADRVRTALGAGAGVAVDSVIGGRKVPSATIEEALAAIGNDCLRSDPGIRLVLSGGDTSGNVLRRLGVERLRIAARPWGNVALCHASGHKHLEQLEVVLKGGQMGHTDLFDDIRTGQALTADPLADPTANSLPV